MTFKNITIQLGLLWVFLVATALPSFCQDPFFSQYYLVPQQLNPAVSSSLQGKQQFAINYRSQWNASFGDSGFKSYSLNANFKIPVLDYDYLSLGFTALQDKAADGAFTQHNLKGMVSYMKKIIDEYDSYANHYISIGANVGFYQNSLDWSNLWFGEQFDLVQNIVDLNKFSREPAQFSSTFRSKFNLDYDVGLYWMAVSKKGLKTYAGAALHHLTKPNVSLVDGGDFSLYRKWVGHIGAELPMSRTWKFIPQLVGVFQGPTWRVQIGSDLKYANFLEGSVAFRLGVGLRFVPNLIVDFNQNERSETTGFGTESLVLRTGFETSKLIIGLSYDINISSLVVATNNRGAFEISLIYKNWDPYEKERR